jgi:hypothetical protein
VELFPDSPKKAGLQPKEAVTIVFYMPEAGQKAAVFPI